LQEEEEEEEEEEDSSVAAPKKMFQPEECEQTKKHTKLREQKNSKK
jgi:hypothetical protein